MNKKAKTQTRGISAAYKPVAFPAKQNILPEYCKSDENHSADAKECLYMTKSQSDSSDMYLKQTIGGKKTKQNCSCLKLRSYELTTSNSKNKKKSAYTV